MTLSEQINRMIQTALESMDITSANPTHINKLIQINALENPDLEDELKDAIADTGVKENEKIQNNIKDVKKLKDGPVGQMNDMLPQHFNNIKQFSQNPGTFVYGALFRKLAKGAGVILLVSLIFEAVKFIISELLKPGRLLDKTFKRDIRRELLFFRLREDQQKLRQGFSRVIITTMPRLRGGQGQTGDSFAPLASGDFVLTEEPYEVEIPKGTPLAMGKYNRRRSYVR